jgi:hypothetical protein
MYLGFEYMAELAEAAKAAEEVKKVEVKKKVEVVFQRLYLHWPSHWMTH